VRPVGAAAQLGQHLGATGALQRLRRGQPLRGDLEHRKRANRAQRLDRRPWRIVVIGAGERAGEEV